MTKMPTLEKNTQLNDYQIKREDALEKLNRLLPLLVDVSNFYYDMEYKLEDNYHTSFEDHIKDYLSNMCFLDDRTRIESFLLEVQDQLETIKDENDERTVYWTTGRE